MKEFEYQQSELGDSFLVEEGAVEAFRQLRVYQAAFEFQQCLFECSKRFPKEEKYSLTDQVRRSSRSIGANIAEAWQKRDYPAHFKSKLTDADAELAETEHWLFTARSCQYLPSEDLESLLEQTRKIGGMLGRMIQEYQGFCRR